MSVDPKHRRHIYERVTSVVLPSPRDATTDLRWVTRFCVNLRALCIRSRRLDREELMCLSKTVMYLDLSGMINMGGLTETFKSLTRLQTLVVWNAVENGELHVESLLSVTPRLKNLKLGFRRVQWTEQVSAHLNELQNLCLQGIVLSPMSARMLSRDLVRLDLLHTQLSVETSNELPVTQLQFLHLEEFQFHEDLFDRVQRMPALKLVKLSSPNPIPNTLLCRLRKLAPRVICGGLAPHNPPNKDQ